MAQPLENITTVFYFIYYDDVYIASAQDELLVHDYNNITDQSIDQ